MSITTPTLRHLGNETADRLVLYLQDDSPDEAVANHKVDCNVRCHAFDAGVVAGRMPAILEEERTRTVNRVFMALRSEMRPSTWDHALRVALASLRQPDDPEATT